MKKYITTTTIVSSASEINFIKTEVFDNYNLAKDIFYDVVACYSEEITFTKATILEEDHCVLNDNNEIYFVTIKIKEDTTKIICHLIAIEIDE